MSELEGGGNQAARRESLAREISLCEAIGAQQSPLCLLSLAVDKKEPFLCSLIPEESSWKSECYARVAALTGQSVLCSKIKTPTIQARCYVAAAAINGDARSCKPMLSADKDRKEGESKIPAIELGSTDWSVTANYDACVAAANRSPAQCGAIDRIRDSDARRLCYQELAIATENSSLCAQLKTDGTSLFVHNCIRDVAIRTARLSDCDEIPQNAGSFAFSTYRDCREAINLYAKTGVRCQERDPLCDGRIAAASRDLTRCRSLRSYTEIDNCLTTYAYQSGDGAVCSELRSSENRAICQQIARTSKSPSPPVIAEAPRPREASPDGRPAFRAAERARMETDRERLEAALYWSKIIRDDLSRIGQRSEELMRLTLLKAEAVESAPRELLIRARSTEISLKIRWCKDGDIKECIEIGEDLFRECQFNQAQDIFLRAKQRLDGVSRQLDGYIFEGDVRQKVDAGVLKSDPSQINKSCATYGLRCCDSPDPEEAALWEQLWRESRSRSNVSFSGHPVQEGLERLWLGFTRGKLLQDQLGFVQGLESIDARAPIEPRNELVTQGERSCDAGESMSCRVLTEMLLSECRYQEAEIANAKMIRARATEVAVIQRLPRSGRTESELRRAIEKPQRDLPSGVFSEERRLLCESARSRAQR